MKNKTIGLLFLWASSIVLSGCSLDSLRDFGAAVGKATAEMMTYRQDDPKYMDTNPRNPFNDIKPGDETGNSIGFYCGDIMHISIIMEYGFIVKDSHQSAFMICNEEKDSLMIYTHLLPYPESYYDTLDNLDHYFDLLAFLVLPEDFGEDGIIRIDGDRVFLRDQTSAFYSVSAVVLQFNEEITSNKYHTGSFVIEYNDLSGNELSLSNGRYKLHDHVVEYWQKRGLKGWWEDNVRGWEKGR